MHKRLQRIIDAERNVEADAKLLAELRALASKDSFEDDFEPAERKAIYQFIWDAENSLLAELIADKFGSSVLLESVMLTMFETGYALGFSKALPID